MPFLSELETRYIGDGKRALTAELLYRYREDLIRVPIGFVTDFASIPNAMRWLISGNDNTVKPSVVHDYLYRKKIATRRYADHVFMVAMKEAGVPWWKRRACWLAVRAFGWIGRDW